MIKRKILMMFLAIGLVTTFGTVDSNAKERFVKPVKRVRIAAGEVIAYNTKDTYVDIRDIANINEQKLLQLSGFEANYSVTGTEANYYTESASDSKDLETLLTKRVTFNNNDLTNLKNAQGVGHYVIKGVYHNQEVIDAGFSGTVNFEINVNVIDSKVSIYDEDAFTSPVAVLHVHNFELGLDKAKAFTENSAKTIAESQFKAWDAAVVGGNFDGGSLAPGKNLAANVKVDANDLSKIKNATEAGAYQLKYTLSYYNSNSVSKTITVFVSDKNTVIDRQQELVIFAKDFSIDIEDAKIAKHEHVFDHVQPKTYDYFTGELKDDVHISINTDNLNTVANGIVTGKNMISTADVKEAKVDVTHDDGAKNIKTNAVAKINYTSAGTDTGTDTGPGGNDSGNTDANVSELPNTGLDSLHFSLVAFFVAIVSYMGYSYNRR